MSTLGWDPVGPLAEQVVTDALPTVGALTGYDVEEVPRHALVLDEARAWEDAVNSRPSTVAAALAEGDEALRLLESLVDTMDYAPFDADCTASWGPADAARRFVAARRGLPEDWRAALYGRTG